MPVDDVMGHHARAIKRYNLMNGIDD